MAHSNQPPLSYYEWTSKELTLLEEDVAIFTRAGLPESDPLSPAPGLLVDEPALEPTDQVLILEPSSGALSLATAWQLEAGHATVLCSHASVLEATQRNLANHDITNATVLASDLCAAVQDQPGRFDVLLATVPKGKSAVARLIRDAGTLLRPGGSFYLAGGNDEGIKSAGKRLERAFGEVVIRGYRKGNRLLHATLPEEGIETDDLDDEDYYTFREMEVKARGQSWRVVTKPGVFAWDRLDPATGLLLDHLEIGAGDQVLDLGTGYGIIGLVAASLAPKGHVDMVEAHVASVEAARRTLEINGVGNASVFLSDAAEAVKRRYDVVITNPPFHQGYGVDFTVVRQFIRDAHRLLTAGGRFWMVANRALRVSYPELIEQQFGNVTTIVADPRWQLLRATK